MAAHGTSCRKPLFAVWDWAVRHPWRVLRCCPPCASHSLTVLSTLPMARVEPSGLKATLVTSSECPCCGHHVTLINELAADMLSSKRPYQDRGPRGPQSPRPRSHASPVFPSLPVVLLIVCVHRPLPLTSCEAIAQGASGGHAHTTVVAAVAAGWRVCCVM